MINQELRSKGIGASEVAALLGMDPRRDALAVWARKLNLVDEPESNIRMRKGRYFEQGIVQWYTDETGLRTEWSDTTMQNPQRSWQIATPDAFVVSDHSPIRIGGVDAKLVSWDQRELWGDPGTNAVPDHYAIQAQWTCSTLDQPWWDIAACVGDELRVYRIHRDPEIEKTLLSVVDKFWKENILGRTQPPIGATDTAAAYLKKRFPKHVQPLRVATPEEGELMALYKLVREEWDAMEARYVPVENRVREVIGDAEGIINGPWKITFKKDSDSMGTDWYAVAKNLVSVPCTAPHQDPITDCISCGGTGRVVDAAGTERLRLMEAAHRVVTRQGPRKLRPTFGKKG